MQNANEVAYKHVGSNHPNLETPYTGSTPRQATYNTTTGRAKHHAEQQNASIAQQIQHSVAYLDELSGLGARGGAHVQDIVVGLHLCVCVCVCVHIVCVYECVCQCVFVRDV
jgi:hypothetical protein